MAELTTAEFILLVTCVGIPLLVFAFFMAIVK